MQQVKDLSVTQLVSSCFQEKKKWHIRFLHLTPGKFPLCSQAAGRRSDHCCHGLKWHTLRGPVVPRNLGTLAFGRQGVEKGSTCIWKPCQALSPDMPLTSSFSFRIFCLRSCQLDIIFWFLWCWYTSTRKEGKRKGLPPSLSSANEPPTLPQGVFLSCLSNLDWASVALRFQWILK